MQVEMHAAFILRGSLAQVKFRLKCPARLRGERAKNFNKLESPCSTRAAEQRRCGESRPSLHRTNSLSNSPCTLGRARRRGLM